MKPKKILVCGLSGSGKSTLAEPLARTIDAVWLNADQVRKEMDDWSFSDEGRKRQANRMRYMADVLIKAGKNVVADFICPTEETRKDFGADFTIWVDTTKQSKFADTDAIFEKPSQVDYHITEWVDFDEKYCYNIYRMTQEETTMETIRDSGEYKSGKKVGHYIKYRLDDKIEEETWFDEDGEFKKRIRYQYYGNGQLKTYFEFDENGLLSGESTQYFDDGRIMMIEHYKEHKKHGKEITYSVSGDVSSEYTFKKGVIDGPFIRYWNHNEDNWDGSRISEEGEYRNGELHGKADEYFTGGDSKRVSSEASSDMSSHSLFSDLKRQQTGDPVPRPINRKYFTGETEVWKTDYPTRTDISNIENEKEIIPIFGDSFIFGDGLPTKYELGTLLRKERPDILFPNFGSPGAGNNRITSALEKWTNDEYSKKTKTIIVGLSSMYRFDYYVDSQYPDSLEGVNAFHKRSDEHWGLDSLRTYNFSAADSVDSSLDNEPKSTSKKKLIKIVNDAKNGTLRSHTTYANVYFKNLETNLRRIDWITRAMNWNIILVRIGGWEMELHPTDAKIINRYITEMNIENRRCDSVHMRNDEQSTIVDVLDCGHWGHETNGYLAREIKNIL